MTIVNVNVVKPYTDENLEVHVDEADEGENPGGEGGVPDQGEGVPATIIVSIIIVIIITIITIIVIIVIVIIIITIITIIVIITIMSNQKIKVGSLLVWLGSTALVPLF